MSIIHSEKTQIILIVFAVSILLIIGAVFYFEYEAGPIREMKRQEIKAIADLKIGQIAQWEKERAADAVVNSSSIYFVEGIEKWVNNRSDETLEKELYKRLALSKEYYDMEDIFITSSDGNLLLSLSNRKEKLDSLTKAKILEASDKKEVKFTDLFKCTQHNKIHYDIISPLVNRKNKVLATMIFRFDPEKYLYPLINLWPLPSKTAETIILKREGDNVVFLNDQLHENSRAFNYKISLKHKERLPVQAVLGKIGITEGKDYKGETVLAYSMHIPNTSWYMLVKISKKEVYADIYFRAIVISAFTAALILIVIIGMLLLFSIKKKTMYKELLEIEVKADEAIRKSEARLKRAEFMSKTGNWEIPLTYGTMIASEGAARIYGVSEKKWDLKEIQSIPLVEFREKLDIALKDIIESGKPYDVEFKIRKADSGEIADIHSIAEYDKDKQTLFGVIQDVTERKRTEEIIRKALREKDSMLKEIHHRVKNNLQVISSLLSLQSDYIGEENLRNVFKESRNRVKTMAIMHERLYKSNDFSQIDIREYLIELVGYLNQMFLVDTSLVMIKFEVGHATLSIDTAIPVGLIVNELVSNSFKYAFPGGRSGEIIIKFCKSGDEYQLSVSDNGIGLGENIDVNNLPSLGLMLVDALAKQINGNMVINGKIGTNCMIKFPTELKETVLT